MLKLAAEPRQVFGKQLKKSRAAGKLPVVLYGAKDAAQPLFVETREFQKVFRTAGESAMVQVVTGTGEKDVLIHEVAFHPVSGEPIHADLYVVDKTKTIETAVPLRYAGVAAAVRDLGGTLVKVLHGLEIEVLPTEIPHEIVVDISKLETLESQVLVKDLAIPKGVKVLVDPEAVVAAIAVAKEEVEAAPVDLSAIEVEKKGKQEEPAETPEAAA